MEGIVNEESKHHICHTDILNEYTGASLVELDASNIQYAIEGATYKVYSLEHNSKCYLLTIATCSLNNKETIDKILKIHDDANTRADLHKNFGAILKCRNISYNPLQIFSIETLYEYSKVNISMINDKREIIKKMSKVAEAMKILEKEGLCNGMLRPKALFLKEGRIKVPNFGFPLSDTKQDIYTAPEVTKKQIAYKLDVYSFGMMLYQLLSGEHKEYHEESQEKFIQKVKSLRFDEDEEYNGKVVGLIRKTLRNNPEERSSFEEIVKALKELNKDNEERSITPSDEQREQSKKRIISQNDSEESENESSNTCSN